MGVSEAVAKTGKSERTIRRWIQEGALETTRRGGALLVWIPTPAAAPDTTVTQQLALIERQAELLERLTQQQAHLAAEQAERQAAPLREKIERQEATIREQDQELGRLREVERELTAELERLAPPGEAPAGRPWWRRWWGGE